MQTQVRLLNEKRGFNVLMDFCLSDTFTDNLTGEAQKFSGQPQWLICK